MESAHYVDLVPDEFKVIEELSQTATQIALHNYKWRYTTFVFFNSTLWCGVELFLQSYRKSSIVGKGTFFPKFVHKTSQYVLFGMSIKDIEYSLIWMRNHEFDNNGKYIIVCATDSDDCDETRAVKTLWAYKITNVVYLKSAKDKVLGYTYYPLSDSDCRTDLPVELNYLNSCMNKTFANACSDLYPTKIKNWNYCTLVASSFNQPPYMQILNGIPSGANGDLLLILAEGLNASLVTMSPRIGNGWGALNEEGTWYGSLADVYYDYANLSMTSAAITLSRFSYFQLSSDYHTASVVWVTHPARLMPSSLKLTRPFARNVQIAVILSFMVVVTYALLRTRLWNFHSKVVEESKPRSSIVFYSWMICMGLPTTKLPTKPVYLYMVLQWMWFCFFIRTVYQVSLITVLKANYYFGEFETIYDAIEAGYPFGGGSALKDYYIDQPVIYDNWINVATNDIIPTMRNVSEGYEFVLAMSLETAHSIISTEKINVHILPQKVITSPTVIFFKKFSPLTESINRVLVKLVESGFSDKLKKIYSSSSKVNRTSDTLEAINLTHFTSCYLVLLAGWIVSFLCFVTEIMYRRILKPPCTHP